MCGIFAILSKTNLSSDDKRLGEQGTYKLHHRGPDHSCIWTNDENLLIGHTRLSIVDLTNKSDQPMTRHGHTIAFNGEIYNYLEIRKQLSLLGYVFNSSGDTEVFLYAWIEWGQKAFDKIDGMFSVVLWDGEKLLLATDPFGEKTLYYAVQGEKVFISSELSVLVDLLNLTPSDDQLLSIKFLIKGYIPAPETMYKNTFKMKSAEVIIIKNGRVLNKSTYWNIPKIAEGKTRKISKKSTQKILDVLIESIESRLNADVPMCLFLSSGIDSSLIAAIIKLELNREIDTLTVSFDPNNKHSECNHANQVANYLGLDHTCLNVDSSNHNNIANEIIDLYGQPFDTLTALAIMDMSDAASKKYKVGITGFGGDEVFMGYGKHYFAYKYRHLLNSNSQFKSLAGLFSKHVFSNKSVINKWMLNLINVKDHEKYTAMKIFPLLSDLKSLKGLDTILKNDYSQKINIENLTYYEEIAKVMPDSRCISLDLGSMHSSFEMRTPFLSRKLVETVNQYGLGAFIHSGQKQFLRSLLGNYLPNSLIDRPKKGFIFPQEWVVNQYNEKNLITFLPDSMKDIKAMSSKGGNWKRMAVRIAILNKFKHIYNL